MTPGRWQVRAVQPTDRAGWDRVYATYLDFYGESVPDAVADHVFARLVDPDDDAMLGLVATGEDGTLVGLATVVVHPNTWSDRLDAYLEDLATDPGHRGQGIGHALIGALVERARRSGWRRVHWHTEQDNARARRLYDDVADLTEYVRYVVEVG